MEQKQQQEQGKERDHIPFKKQSTKKKKEEEDALFWGPQKNKNK
jgi:hypothetical protein